MSQLASGTAACEYQSTIASARYFGFLRRKPNRKTLQGDPDDGAPQADSTPDIPAPFKRDQFLIWFIHGPAEKDTLRPLSFRQSVLKSVITPTD